LASVRFGLALAALGGGLSLGCWTMGLFWRFGEGTPAPWDLPTRLVIRGPYRYVRNPMSVLALRGWPYRPLRIYYQRTAEGLLVVRVYNQRREPIARRYTRADDAGP
jgi:hypothetical protein